MCSDCHGSEEPPVPSLPRQSLTRMVGFMFLAGAKIIIKKTKKTVDNGLYLC